MKKLLYSALYRDDCYPFHVLAHDVSVASEPDDLKEKDSMLVVWGGADIDPAYYGHPKHSTTSPGGERDRREWALMQAAKEKGIPIIGVCRGAQMLTALSGGWLFQHVHGHAGRAHLVTTFDNKMLPVNSLHHQMMGGLEQVDHQLVAWSSNRISEKYGYKDDQTLAVGAGLPDDFKEPEFVYFPQTKGYAIQWHPEMMVDSCAATRYILDFINKKEEEHAGYAYVELTC